MRHTLNCRTLVLYRKKEHGEGGKCCTQVRRSQIQYIVCEDSPRTEWYYCVKEDLRIEVLISTGRRTVIIIAFSLEED
jgi:hypothetical protein